MSWEDMQARLEAMISGVAKKRKTEEEMEGEIVDLATENGLLKAEVKKLRLENKSLQEREAKEKVKVKELEGREKDLLAEFSHIKGQKAKVGVNKGEAPGLGKEKDDEKKDDSTPVFHFASPKKEAEELCDKKSIREAQSKTSDGKASEVDTGDAGAELLRSHLQKLGTSIELQAINQDDVVFIEETVDEGKAKEVKDYKQVLEELQMLVECPVCMTTPKEGPMPCCPAGHLTCAPCQEVMRKKGKKMCPSCRGPLGKGKSLLSSAIIKTIEVKDSVEEQSIQQPVESQMPGPSKVAKAFKGKVLTPGKPSPKVSKGSPVLAKKKLSIGGAAVGNTSGALARFEGSCPLCGKKFMDAMLLETHTSECNGSGEQMNQSCSNTGPSSPRSALLKKWFGSSSDDSDN